MNKQKWIGFASIAVVVIAVGVLVASQGKSKPEDSVAAKAEKQGKYSAEKHHQQLLEEQEKLMKELTQGVK